jgi:putative transposase
MHPVALAELDERQRAEVTRRWQVLRPVVQDGVPLTVAARDAGVPLRSAQRWLGRYRTGGLAALARAGRSDRGRRRLPPELVRLVEGLALQRPRPSAASITRWVKRAAEEHDWPVPSYSTVYSIVTALDPQLSTLAHAGPAALRDRYELVYRRQSQRPNQIWQADHTELDLLVLDHAGRPARPWLTVLLDDCSRAIAGYTVFLGAPSALNLSLALRQAIWRKTDPAWPVHGLPDVLYADHAPQAHRPVHRHQGAPAVRRVRRRRPPGELHRVVLRPRRRRQDPVRPPLHPLGHVAGGGPPAPGPVGAPSLSATVEAAAPAVGQRAAGEPAAGERAAWRAERGRPRRRDAHG